MDDLTRLTPPDARALKMLVDRAAITQVVQDWGLARDAGRWERLRSFFTPDAVMHTTWFVGSADEFVNRSLEASKNGARAQHFIGAATIEVQGVKAIAETRMIIFVRGRLDGVEVEVTCHGRFYDRFVRREGAWRIQRRTPIYEKDRLDALDPSALIKLDADKLALHPDGYRHVAYLQSSGGAQITAELPTSNSAVLARLYAEGDAWLADASA